MLGDCPSLRHREAHDDFSVLVDLPGRREPEPLVGPCRAASLEGRGLPALPGLCTSAIGRRPGPHLVRHESLRRSTIPRSRGSPGTEGGWRVRRRRGPQTFPARCRGIGMFRKLAELARLPADAFLRLPSMEQVGHYGQGAEDQGQGACEGCGACDDGARGAGTSRARKQGCDEPCQRGEQYGDSESEKHQGDRSCRRFHRASGELATG